MQKVKIITHSGSDLTFPEARALNITLLPDLVVFGNEQFRNNIDIFPDAFFARLEQDDVFPTSAHPNLLEFMDAFRDAADYEAIICLVMSSQMTNTISTAKIAAQMIKEEEDFRPDIYIYDSQQVSYGLGMAVLDAARMAMDGCGAQEILSHLDAIVPRIGVYFVMKSLKYAHKGGRIGAIKAVTADALGVKPLLSFRDGTVSDILLNRRFSDGVQAIFKKYQRLAGEDPDVFVFHARNEEAALQLQSMIEAYNPAARIQIRPVGPAVGIYTGIGCVGIAFKEKPKT